MPSVETNFVNKETGEIEVKYRPGHPRQYRFDASRGMFNVAGNENLTKKGEALSFIPVAYRIFKDDILGYGLKSWAEFFFINNSGHMCSLLFHGYSVENLEKCTNDLFYDDVNLAQVTITATPIEKTKNSEGEGKGNKYFMAEFSYKVLTEEKQKEIKPLGEDLQIFRQDTLTGDCKLELSVGYKPNIQMLNGSGTVEAEAIEVDIQKEESKEAA